MPTNPTLVEWRRDLVFSRDDAENDGEFTTAAYLTSLLREWDAHEPAFEHEQGYDPEFYCPNCFDCGLDSNGLCPARRRMMGGGDGSD